MKKTVSVLLVLLLAFAMPFSLNASAADTYAVTLTLPEDRQGDLWLVYDEEAYPDLSAIPAGTVFEFELGLNEMYDPNYTAIFVDGVRLDKMADGKYGLLMNKDMEISCPTNNGLNFQLKTFIISNPSGDGYRVRPAAIYGYQNYRVEWGGSYEFRVILDDEYAGAFDGDYETSRLSVYVVYTTIVDGVEQQVELNVGDPGFSFVGTDTDGSPLFRLDNITQNMDVRVSMIMSDSIVNIIDWVKRIVRLLINLLTGKASLGDALGGLGIGGLLG